MCLFYQGAQSAWRLQCVGGPPFSDSFNCTIIRRQRNFIKFQIKRFRAKVFELMMDPNHAIFWNHWEGDLLKEVVKQRFFNKITRVEVSTPWKTPYPPTTIPKAVRGDGGERRRGDWEKSWESDFEEWSRAKHHDKRGKRNHLHQFSKYHSQVDYKRQGDSWEMHRYFAKDHPKEGWGVHQYSELQGGCIFHELLCA